MVTELEAKIRVTDHDAVRRALQAAGATLLRRVFEVNRLLDREDATLRNKGCGLRVRTACDESDGNVTSTVTFKGPRKEAAFKHREEIETQVDNADAMYALFKAIGFTSEVIFEKRRESWSLDDCLVELDEVPKLGKFVEIEGPSEDAIHAIIKKLELNDHERILESYVALLVAEAGESSELRFCFS